MTESYSPPPEDRTDAAATPDEEEAEEAQRGVQAAFETGLEGS